jgi:DNA-binding transcriptional ArsR family regulator
MDNVPVEERRPDAFVPIRPAYMAKMANSSPATISRHLRRLEENGIIERKIETVYDAERESFISQTFVRPKVDLADPTVLVVPSEHGGSRKVRCVKPGCGSSNIVDKIERICLDCNTPQSEVKYVPINEPDDLTDETAYASAIEAEQTASERAISSCAPISNVPVLETTNGSDLVGLQDEIAVAVPPLIEETLDLTTAIRAADRYSPAEDEGRFAYKSALAWLHRDQPIKAEAYLDRIKEPQARAIVEHLVARGAQGVLA